MIPPKIIAAAAHRNIDGICITDHNSAGNVKAVRKAGNNNIVVFGGMEITTAEEIHLLALFAEGDGLYLLENLIEKHIHGQNDPERFGEQYVVDEEGYITGISDVFLSSASDLSIEEAVETVHKYEGIAIAAHIDRESYSIVSQLGFIPDSLPIDGVEVSQPAGINMGGAGGRELPVFASSDAHTPEMIGSAASIVRCEKLTFDELKAAVAGDGGRGIKPVWGREADVVLK